MTIRSYDAFISYSHRDAMEMGPAIQSALHRLGKPWYRLRSCRAFVDRTDLSATPGLWPDIERALLASRCLIFVASVEAAQSVWMTREISAWLEAGRSPENLLLVLVGGEIAWDTERLDFDWGRTTALPRRLSRVFEHEPLWVDLRFAAEAAQRGLHHPEFATAIARLAAPVRGLDVEVLISTDYRERRRALRLAWSAILLLLIFAVTIFVLFIREKEALRAAEQARDDATRQRSIALARLADAQVARVRAETVKGQYDLAWAYLADAEQDDPRLALARWVVDRHRSYTTRMVQNVVPGGAASLAVHARSGELVALERRRADDQPQRVLAFDADSLQVVASVPALGRPTAIVPSVRPHEFWATGGDLLTRYTLESSTWRAAPVSVDPPLREVAWFANVGAGIGLRGRDVMALQFDDTGMQQVPLARTFENAILTRSRDGNAIAVEDAPKTRLQLFEPSTGAPRFVADYPGGTELVGETIAASVVDGEKLHWRRWTDGHEAVTRPYFRYKRAFEGTLVVQQVGDTTQRAVAKMSVLDLATGGELLAPFYADEPIWADAVDASRSRLYLTGQGGWLLTAYLDDRVEARTLPTEVEGPFWLLHGTDELVVRDARNRLDRSTVHLDLRTLKARREPARFPTMKHELPDGGSIHWHECPFRAALSPDGARLAFAGSEFWVVTLPQATRAALQAGGIDLATACQRVLEALPEGAWRVDLEPPHALRWLSDTLLVIRDFHGGARRLDVTRRQHTRILDPESVGALSEVGPVRLSTLSGTVYELQADGEARPLAKVADLLALYPLIAAGAGESRGVPPVFVGAMNNPLRTAFLMLHEGTLEEIVAIPNTGAALDARLVADGVVVLYANSVRVYPGPLPLSASVPGH